MRNRKTQLLDCSVIPPLANADHNGLELSVTNKSHNTKNDLEVATITRMQTTERHVG